MYGFFFPLYTQITYILHFGCDFKHFKQRKTNTLHEKRDLDEKFFEKWNGKCDKKQVDETLKIRLKVVRKVQRRLHQKIGRTF